MEKKVESKYGTKDGGKPMEPEESLGVLTPERFADWLINYHGAKAGSRETIISNLRSQLYATRALGFCEGRTVIPAVHIHLSIFGRRDKVD